MHGGCKWLKQKDSLRWARAAVHYEAGLKPSVQGDPRSGIMFSRASEKSERKCPQKCSHVRLQQCNKDTHNMATRTFKGRWREHTPEIRFMASDRMLFWLALWPCPVKPERESWSPVGRLRWGMMTDAIELCTCTCVTMSKGLLPEL